MKIGDDVEVVSGGFQFLCEGTIIKISEEERIYIKTKKGNIAWYHSKNVFPKDKSFLFETPTIVTGQQLDLVDDLDIKELERAFFQLLDTNY